MDKRDKKIRQLENERNQLMAENQELKYIINDIQSVNDIMREDIEKECAAECGCIVIEGSRTSAAYQDLVGILLANNYSVEVIPMDERRKLKIIIKESEVFLHLPVLQTEGTWWMPFLMKIKVTP